MIDRNSIAAEVRQWVQEATGLGFKGTRVMLLQEGGIPDRLHDLTARGTASRVRRRPDTRVERLSPAAARCEAILAHIDKVDDRYRRALILYACVRPLSEAAKGMRKQLPDFVRFAEGGIAIYGLLQR